MLKYQVRHAKSQVIGSRLIWITQQDAFRKTTIIRASSPLKYAKKSPSDAPYDLTESALRRVIYISSTHPYDPNFWYRVQGMLDSEEPSLRSSLESLMPTQFGCSHQGFLTMLKVMRNMSPTKSAISLASPGTRTSQSSAGAKPISTHDRPSSTGHQ